MPYKRRPIHPCFSHNLISEEASASASGLMPRHPRWPTSLSHRSSAIFSSSSSFYALASTPTQSPGSQGLQIRPLLKRTFNGIATVSLAERLSHFLHHRKVASIQETKLQPRNKNPNIPGHNVLRKDRPGGGRGGVALLVHRSVTFSPINLWREQLGAKIRRHFSSPTSH